ncbi:hypothetical protein NCCP436_28340 [Pseudomonas sp. NCCP-436]|nr:hypothetical protein NCCP436_28340 [Pseudomonas sp. NCCP-436]
MFEHVPAVLMQSEVVASFATAVEHPEAFRAEHPLVTIGHGEIAIIGLHVEGNSAELLDSIDAEQYTMPATALTEAGQIQTQAAGELHCADRHQPCARG